MLFLFPDFCYHMVTFFMSFNGIFRKERVMGDESLRLIWQKAKECIKKEMHNVPFDTWIAPMEPVFADDNVFVLSVPDVTSAEYAASWIPLIKSSVKHVSHHDYGIEIVVRESQKMADLLRSYTKRSIDAATVEEQTRTGSKLKSDYVFDSFIVGSGNRFAHAACVAIAENLGGKNYHKPLFLYGGSGLGKTHLMHAIGNYVTAKRPDKSVIYIQCEQFVNEFISTIRENAYDSFRERYRNADFLLIDDIQFIEGKEQTQIEFFHTFNALYDSGKRIVMTCDKPPQSLSSLEERLRSRFSSGLIVDIQPPDYETRMAILRKWAEQNNTVVPDDVLDYIASNIATNIRELEGAFSTVLAFSALSGKLDIQSAESALKDIVSAGGTKSIDANGIIDVVSRYYNVSAGEILSKRRSKDVAIPRQVSMYLCRFLLNMTLPKIGDTFGGRDHTTVMHACNKMSADLNNVNSLFSRDIEEIKKRLGF